MFTDKRLISDAKLALSKFIREDDLVALIDKTTEDEDLRAEVLNQAVGHYNPYLYVYYGITERKRAIDWINFILNKDDPVGVKFMSMLHAVALCDATEELNNQIYLYMLKHTGKHDSQYL